jgi:hypothetical protein
MALKGETPANKVRIGIERKNIWMDLLRRAT